MQRNQRAHPSCPVVPIIVLELIFKCNDYGVSNLSRSGSFAVKHGPERFVVDEFLRKAEIECTRSPVRNVEKDVEVLLKKFERICFQVPPLVAIRETR